MFPMIDSIKPAVQTHLNAQLSFFHDLTQSLLDSVEKISALNLQLAQGLIENGAQTGRDILTAKRLEDVLTASASQAQPVAEKLRTYKENLAQLATQAQSALTQVAEQHAPETQRTGKALAEEIIRAAAQEGQKAMQRQQGAVHNVAEQVKTQTAAASDLARKAWRSGDDVQDVTATEVRHQQDSQQDTVARQADNAAEAVKHSADEVTDAGQDAVQAAARSNGSRKASGQPGSTS